jgi:hypothetical protein
VENLPQPAGHNLNFARLHLRYPQVISRRHEAKQVGEREPKAHRLNPVGELIGSACPFNRRVCINPPRSGALNLARFFKAGNSIGANTASRQRRLNGGQIHPSLTRRKAGDDTPPCTEVHG